LSLPTPAELTAEHWRSAGRALVAKAIAEFCYEELLTPTQEGAGRHRIELPGNVHYRFTAKRGAYGSWFVIPGSVSRHAPGADQEADDALRFVLDAHQALGLSGDTAGHLIRELNATLAADVKLLATGGLSAAALAELPYEQLEGHQTGHPWIVLNKGRVGFSSTDAQVYPPEARKPMVLPWIAARRDLAVFRGVPGLTAEKLYNSELDGSARADFTNRLMSRGLDPSAYWWLPVHPWQWDETILPLFTGQIADQLIVPLGDGSDAYLPQQSIRTFTNVTSPLRRNVKLPLSVLNTLVWRGLPTERTVAAPAVTAWVQGIAAKDGFLRDETRVILLGEVASVTVSHPVLDELAGIPYQYRELLGAIWREPLAAALEPGERARTLASLLQVDPDGRALVTELVARSGLRPKAWLGKLFHAMLPPLLHFLYQYGTVFSPHGENAIVVYDGHDVPTRLAVKDFVDDVNISAEPLPELADLPPEVGAVLLREAPDYLCQFLHAALFIGHYRYLAELFERQLGVRTEEFWAMLRAEIVAYQQAFPQLAERFETFDLFTERIDRLCLNRNRLLLDGYRDRPERPHAAVHGEVLNPLFSAE
jgi:siderophore synthetase component